LETGILLAIYIIYHSYLAFENLLSERDGKRTLSVVMYRSGWSSHLYMVYT